MIIKNSFPQSNSSALAHGDPLARLTAYKSRDSRQKQAIVLILRTFCDGDGRESLIRLESGGF